MKMKVNTQIENLKLNRNNLDTYEEVIYECSNDKPTDMMEDCVNRNLDDKNKNNLNEVNEIFVDDEER